VLLGPRAWPGVAVGAFVANVTSACTPAIAAGIAVGNTLEALVGAYLLRRVGFRPGLDRVRDVLALVVGGALLSTVVSATNGVTILTLADETGSYGSAWLLWWLGDAVGDLMVAPLIFVLIAHAGLRPTRQRVVEGGLLLASVAAVSSVVFFAGAWRYPYVLFPLLLWAALRFRQLGVATTAFLVGALGIAGTLVGTVPLSVGTPTERVQIVQALFAVVSVSLFVVGATLAEREESHRELVQTAARLSEAQALTHIGSWEWDVASDRVIWSDELYRIFGVEPAPPVTYASYLALLHPEDRAYVDETVKRAYASGQPFVLEHRVLLANGAERHVLGHGRVVHGADGLPVRMLGTAQDVTEQRQIEALRDDILAAISHELRTPLTSVLGSALTLEHRRGQLPQEDVDALVAQLAREAGRLDRLLSDLLDLDRLRLGRIEPVRRATDVEELVRRVVARVDSRVVDVTGGPVTASVDSAKLERIVENLVLNAVKHTPPETGVGVRLDQLGDDLLIVVNDRGPGVPDEFKQAVFETFNRGAKIRSSTPGAGIGLALVSRFAALHGGRAWVDDREGGGASFCVLLPDAIVADGRLAQRQAISGER
jgi:signal transduction histidine kinase